MAMNEKLLLSVNHCDSCVFIVLLPRGCVQTGCSWIQRRQRSSGPPPVAVSTNFRSHHSEL